MRVLAVPNPLSRYLERTLGMLFLIVLGTFGSINQVHAQSQEYGGGTGKGKWWEPSKGKDKYDRHDKYTEPECEITGPDKACGPSQLTFKVDFQHDRYAAFYEYEWYIQENTSGAFFIDSTGREVTLNSGDQEGYFVLKVWVSPKHDKGGYSQSWLLSKYVVVKLKPEAGEGSTLEVCLPSSETIDLFDLVEGEDAGGKWFLVSDPSGEQNEFLESSLVDGSDLTVGEYQYKYVVYNKCGKDVAYVTIIGKEASNIVPDSAAVCLFGLDSVNLFQVFPGLPLDGTWFDATETGQKGDPISPIVQGSDLEQGDNFFFFEPPTSACQTGDFPFVIKGDLQSFGGVGSVLTVCEDADNEPLESVNLFDLIEGENPEHEGEWVIADRNVDAAILDDSISTFIDTIPGFIRYAYTDSNSCGAAEPIFAGIDIRSIPSPGIGDSLLYCNIPGQEIDLFDILQGEEPGGVWVNETAGEEGEIVDSGIVQSEELNPGLNRYIYELPLDSLCSNDVPRSGPHGDGEVDIVLLDTLSAGAGRDTVLCKSIVPDPDNSFDLNDLLVGEEPGGMWFELVDGIPVAMLKSSIIDPDTLSLGLHTFQYSQWNACGDTFAEADVFLDEAPFGGFTPLLFPVCRGEDTVNLSDFLRGETPGGTWTDINGNVIPGGIVSVDTLPFGRNEFVYTLESPCGNVEVNLAFTLFPPGEAGEPVENPVSVCQIGETSFDLNDLIVGEDTGGTWTNLTTNEVYDTNVVDLTGLDPGSYMFRYFVEALCGDDSVDVQVNLESGGSAGQGGSTTLCEGAMKIFDLSTLLTDADPGGQWYDINNAQDLPSSIITLDNYFPGTWLFRYTVDGSCGTDTTIVTVEILSAPLPGYRVTEKICTDDAGVINLDSLLTNVTPGGSWYDITNDVPLESPIVDLSGQPEGSYKYRYDVSNICGSSQSFVTIKLKESPNAGQDAAIRLCQSDDLSSVDLLTPLGASGSGVWTEISEDPSGVEIGDGTSVDFTGVPVGEYTFKYVVGNAYDACGTDEAFVIVNIRREAYAGKDGKVGLCEGDTEPINLPFYLGENVDEGGVWSEVGNPKSNVDLSDPTSVDFSEVSPGKYKFKYRVAGPLICVPDEAFVTVKVGGLNLTADVTDATCGGYNGAIDLTVTGGHEPYYYQWSHGFAGEDPTHLWPGEYEVWVTDAKGCSAGLEVTVGEGEADLDADVVKKDAFCDDYHGEIWVKNPTGGSGNYEYGIEGLWYQSDPHFEWVPVGEPCIVKMRDGKCEVILDTITIEHISDLKVSFNIIQPSCDSKGSIETIVEGGTPPYTYEWDNGATTPDLTDLDPGYYTLWLMDSKWCKVDTTVALHFEGGDSYGVIANREAHFGEFNHIYSGSVAVRDDGGVARFMWDAKMYDPNSYVKASWVEDEWNFAPNKYQEPADVEMPPMVYYNGNSSDYEWESVPDYSYKRFNRDKMHVTCGAYSEVVFDGSHYGKMIIQNGAKVRFTNSEVHIEEMVIESSHRDSYTNVSFEDDAKVCIQKNLECGQYVKMNPERKRVNFYVGDQTHPGRCEIRPSGVEFNGNVMMPRGEMYLEENAWEREPGKMHGKFCVDALYSRAQHVHWSYDHCDETPLPRVALKGGRLSAEESEVTIFPNPTKGQFEVDFRPMEGASGDCEMILMGLEGSVIDQTTTSEVGGSFHGNFDLSNYRRGVYLLRVIHNGKVSTYRVTVDR